MSRFQLAFLAVVVLSLTACAGPRETSGVSGAATGPVVARFAPGSLNVVQVAVEDRLPAQDVVLIAPNGTVFPAQTINRDRIVQRYDRYGYYRGYPPGYSEYPAGVGVGVGVFGGSSGRIGTGVGLSFPLGGYDSGYDTVEREVAVKSVARIPVDDMAYYTETWRQWRARVRFVEPDGDSRFLELAAPPPPAIKFVPGQPPPASPPG